MREVRIRSCYYRVLLLLLVLCPMTGAWRSFKVILTGIEFEANAKIVDLNVQLHNDSGDSRVSVDVTTHADLPEVQLSINVGLETDKGNFSPLINRTVNFCKMIKQRSTDPLVRVMYDDLLKHGNIFKECPIRSGTYSLHNYKVDEEMLPSFLPEANFRFVLLILKPKNEMISRITIYGRIDKSKGFDNLKRFSLG